jgi:predicted enzyme related to lactoylglutathione lyase
VPEHTVAHIEIPTGDPTGADQFYSDLFGWKIETMPEFDNHMVNLPGGLTIAFMKPE